MPRNAPRGGPQTRARIAEVASGLFAERGFDAVTVAEIARAAGVSSVTVFKHFPRKEDLFLDRSLDTADLLRSAVRDSPDAATAIESVHAALVRAAGAREPLSGLDPRSVPFFRTLAASPALVARTRETAAQLQTVLADELEGSGTQRSEARLLAALVVAGYGAVLIATAQRMLAGDPADDVARDHAARLDRLFDVLQRGLG